ncbi:hypothetical protein IAQ61_008642 [Plenodomus lingam]|uniref:uncharacterized protein n=1 Tax=Leptosphaeria maculans TaxID=5022 RepID=UPI003328E102|nr:hypothetical protein IAQ61_008642 [Plenodomus lingam]
MNRWLTRKNKDGGDEAAAPKKTKKGKKGDEAPKPELDLAFALPKVDDFRTSLIMPGLSTRFSMLREQDDPASKIGKASDDSVLQPKRQSRLHEFGFTAGGLADIAEVSSLHGSIQPPFATERTNSFDSGRDEESPGSVMTRSRPGEGNVLFGGRQKIYMVANNSSKGLGRTLYDDDVNMSAYQKLRQEEKDRLRREEEEQEEHEGQEQERDHQPSEPSSPTTLSQKRETSSSTNSGTMDTRTSTAATSIASQGANSVAASSPAFSPTTTHPSLELNRPTTKNRRLYDQGLDQHIQEQQSSAMHRLNSIQRARAPTGRSTPPIPLPLARSATNLSDRFNRGPTLRSDSPNLFAYPNVSRNNSSAGSSPVLSRPLSPPLSPGASDSEDAHALNAALQPNDRGKATAMGAFNKPKEAFSEEQYAERLRHLQPKSTPSQATVVPKLVDKLPSRKPSLRERAVQAKRKKSNAAEQIQPQPTPQPPPAEESPARSAFSRFQAAASQIRAAGLASPEPVATQSEERVRDLESSESRGGTTFFASNDSSDAEEGEKEEEQQQQQPVQSPPLALRPSEPSRRFDNLPVATGPAPSLLEHPAMRSRTTSEEHVVQISPPDQPSPTADVSPKLSSEVDSPTLGPDSSGLGGMIRQHLRNGSNVSSTYGEPGPPLMSPPGNAPLGLAIQTQDMGLVQRRQQPGSGSATPAPSTHSHSNPWDLDDIDNNPYRDEQASMASTSPLERQNRQPLILSATEPANGAPWDLTPRRNHERIASNETESEHEAFQKDLAHRQRLIQENLRARAEGRSTSPAPAPGPSGGLKTALNMLRAKSSRESFATVAEQQSSNKSIRKLTVGASYANGSSTSLAGMQGAEMPPLRTKPSRVLQQSEQDAQREMSTRQRSGTDASQTGRPTGRSAAVSTTRSSTRERSGSGTSSARSRSRPGEYRDDLDQAMAEGTRAAYPPNTLPSVPGYVAHPTPPLSAERPSLEAQSRTRSRSNSKTAAASYFESKHLHPIQTGAGTGRGKFSPGIPASPRPSPGGFNSPAGHGYHQPSSPMPPISASNTPPISNPTTPNGTTFNPSSVQPLTRTGVLRKKSVAKSDISEPVFVSTTSVIDTVNLPPGASLKNGIEHEPPPVPPINPMRRRFGFGRGEAANRHDPAIQAGIDTPRAPYAEPLRTNSSDGLASQIPRPRARLRKTSSEGKSLRGEAQGPTGPSPAMPQDGFVNRNNSPPHAMNPQPMAPQPMEGAMF